MRAIGFALFLLAAAPVQAMPVWQGTLDLRNLPANTRPGEVVAQVDASEAVAQGYRPTLSVAVNGIVLAQAPASGSGLTRLSIPVQDRHLSIHNGIEVAATLPDCDGGRCAEALASVRPAGAPRFLLSDAEDEAADFSQLVTRFRAGVTVSGQGPQAERLADLFLGEIAPEAPRTGDGPARLHIGAEPPDGLQPLIRFDLGPVALRRSDGPEILSAREVDARTIVQVLRFGREPVVWIRPGPDAAMPAQMEFDTGDIALFDADGRDLAFSSTRDRVVDIVYPEGADPDDRRTLIFRLVLLGLWLIASILLFRFFRQLPRPQRSDAVA